MLIGTAAADVEPAAKAVPDEAIELAGLTESPETLPTPVLELLPAEAPVAESAAETPAEQPPPVMQPGESEAAPLAPAELPSLARLEQDVEIALPPPLELVASAQEETVLYPPAEAVQAPSAPASPSVSEVIAPARSARALIYSSFHLGMRLNAMKTPSRRAAVGSPKKSKNILILPLPKG